MIERIFDKFWSSIFDKRKTDLDSQDEVINLIDRTLPPAANKAINQPISLKDVQESITSTKLNKAPGSDGLPNEFYDIFSKQDSTLARFLHATLNESYIKN